MTQSCSQLCKIPSAEGHFRNVRDTRQGRDESDQQIVTKNCIAFAIRITSSKQNQVVFPGGFEKKPNQFAESIKIIWIWCWLLLDTKVAMSLVKVFWQTEEWAAKMCENLFVPWNFAFQIKSAVIPLYFVNSPISSWRTKLKVEAVEYRSGHTIFTSAPKTI